MIREIVICRCTSKTVIAVSTIFIYARQHCEIDKQTKRSLEAAYYKSIFPTMLPFNRLKGGGTFLGHQSSCRQNLGKVPNIDLLFLLTYRNNPANLLFNYSTVILHPYHAFILSLLFHKVIRAKIIVPQNLIYIKVKFQLHMAV